MVVGRQPAANPLDTRVYTVDVVGQVLTDVVRVALELEKG
jgi:hypothetical protein